jgi:ABC-type nitrate/sulfonate/bicarbonate transport system permease component
VVTLTDAALGYVVGTAVAVVAAIAIVSARVVEQVVTPIAVVLRSVPIVAMTPLLALVFGRGLLGVTVIVSLVVFFPTLVNMIVGLRSAPPAATDVIRAAGGSTLQAIRVVRVPYALPALFASARIAVPAAIGGATLAEWLATGDGLGSLLVVSYSNSQFSTLWSGSVVIVAVSVLLYSLVSALEGPVLNRFSAQATPH